MDTLPMPPAGQAEGRDEFRLDDAREIASILRRLADADVPLRLHGDAGSAAAATLWASDPRRGTVGLAVDAGDPVLPRLLESKEITVVGMLDDVKLQWEVAGTVLVRSAQGSVLTSAFPAELYRFQRRSAYRVRPPGRSTPIATVRHTDIAEMQLALRVVDISIGGCGLFLPDDVPPMQLGGVMNRVRIDLDDETQFTVDLRLQHVTSLYADAGGVRIGCEFVRSDAIALRALQRFIDRAQQRARRPALEVGASG